MKHFDPVYWWKTKHGIYDMLRYTIGYFYAVVWKF
jgi:hypothetical protein